MRIAFIGLGNMGGPMSTNLLAAGHTLVVHDRDLGAATRQRELGAEWAETPAAAAATADVVITMLPDPATVHLVLHEVAPVLPAGAIWMDMSTSTPETARGFDAVLAERGASRLDAPVSGMARGAKAGALQIFVGGDTADLSRVRPLLDVMGDPERVLHVGDPGAGYTVKLLINLLWFSHLVASAEVLTMGAKAGVDLSVLRDSLLASPAASNFLATDILSVFDGDYDDSFAMILACKDLRLALELGRDVGMPAELSATVDQVYRRALATYGPTAGEMTPIRLYEAIAGLQLRHPRPTSPESAA